MSVITCDAVQGFSVSNTFGATPYSLQLSVGFSSATSFQISFINEDGVYTISKEDLSSETPHQLTIGELVINVYPVSYKISRSPSGKLLSVTYADASIKYLDKHNVALSPVRANRVLNIVPVNVEGDSVNEDISSGTYSPSVLLDAINSSGIPVSDAVRVLLQNFTFDGSVGDGSEDQLLSEQNSSIFNFVGRLRDVLASVATFFSVMFFWNWAGGGEGRLDIIDLKDGAPANNTKLLFDQIMLAYGTKVSSLDESASIEDCESISDVSYISGNSKYVRNRSVVLKKLEVPDRSFTVLGGQTYSTQNGIVWGQIQLSAVGDYADWREMCYASLMGEQFFQNYIIYNLASFWARTWMPVRTGTFGFSQEAYPDDSLRGVDGYSYNIEVIKIFGGNPTDLAKIGKLVYFLDDGQTPDQLLATYGNTAANRASIARGVNPVISEKTKGMRNQGYWLIGVMNASGILNIAPAFDVKKNINVVYQRCRAWALLFNRFFTSDSRWNYEMSERYKPANTGEESELKWYYEYANINKLPGIDTIRQLYHPEADRIAWAPYIGKVRNAQLTWPKPAPIPGISGFESTAQPYEINYLAQEKDSFTARDYGHFVFDAAPARDSDLKIDEYVVVLGEDAIPTTLAEAQSQGIGSFLAVSRNDQFRRKLRALADKEFVVRSSTKSKNLFKEDLMIPYINLSSVIADQNNKWAISNTLDVYRLPSGGTVTTPSGDSQEIMIDLDWYRRFVAQNKLLNPTPTVGYSLQIDSFVSPKPEWLTMGMESFTMSIGGEGVSTSISISSRKKQRQAFENYQKMNFLSFGQFTKVKRMGSSAERISMGISTRMDT